MIKLQLLKLVLFSKFSTMVAKLRRNTSTLSKTTTFMRTTLTLRHAKRLQMLYSLLTRRIQKGRFFYAALEEAREAFDAVMLDFGYHQKLEKSNPDIHQTNPPPDHPFYSAL